MADKAEHKTGEAVSRLKVFGKKVAEKTADQLDNLADSLREKTGKKRDSEE